METDEPAKMGDHSLGGRGPGDSCEEAILIAKGVLLELYEKLPDLRERSVVFGGTSIAEWIGTPAEIGQVRSPDVDLVLDPDLTKLRPHLQQDLLNTNEYEQRTYKGFFVPYSYIRKGLNQNYLTHFDFHSPECEAGTRILIELGDLTTKTIANGELLLTHFVTRTIRGLLPPFRLVEGDVRLVHPFLLLSMKAIAFFERGIRCADPEFRTLKDAADVCALLAFNPFSPGELADLARPYRGSLLVEEALACLKRYFFNAGDEGVDAAVRILKPRVPETRFRTKLTELVREYVESLDVLS